MQIWIDEAFSGVEVKCFQHFDPKLWVAAKEMMCELKNVGLQF